SAANCQICHIEGFVLILGIGAAQRHQILEANVQTIGCVPVQVEMHQRGRESVETRRHRRFSFNAGSTMARASSGSRFSSSSIDPLMSANSAVTVLRSPSGTCAPGSSTANCTAGAGCRWTGGSCGLADRAVAHASQNLAAGLFTAPQAGHSAASGAAQSLQN